MYDNKLMNKKDWRGIKTKMKGPIFPSTVAQKDDEQWGRMVIDMIVILGKGGRRYFDLRCLGYIQMHLLILQFFIPPPTHIPVLNSFHTSAIYGVKAFH